MYKLGSLVEYINENNENDIGRIVAIVCHYRTDKLRKHNFNHCGYYIQSNNSLDNPQTYEEYLKCFPNLDLKYKTYLTLTESQFNYYKVSTFSYVEKDSIINVIFNKQTAILNLFPEYEEKEPEIVDATIIGFYPDIHYSR